jgi:8-oxo-dGTP diphosphatase
MTGPLLLPRFNVRVYGIMIHEDQKVLVSDEYIRGGYYTKFPGGGLEFGEGTLECIKREWKEEIGQDIEVLEHFYTTDFFQISAFDNNSQIISIYYLVTGSAPFPAVTIDTPFDFKVPEGVTEMEAMRWIPLQAFSQESVTLPIDKVVATMIQQRFG